MMIFNNILQRGTTINGIFPNSGGSGSDFPSSTTSSSDESLAMNQSSANGGETDSSTSNQSVGQRTYEIRHATNLPLISNNNPLSKYPTSENSISTTGGGGGGGGSSSCYSTSDSGETFLRNSSYSEALLASSLLPEDSFILDRVSFDLPPLDEAEDNTVTTSCDDINNQFGRREQHNERIIEMTRDWTMSDGESISDSTVTVESTASKIPITNENFQHGGPTPSTTRQQDDTISSPPTATEGKSKDPFRVRPANVNETQDTVDISVCDTIQLSCSETDFDGNNNNITILSSPSQCEEPNCDETRKPPEFAMGDHVYQWCSLAGIPRVFQHHGIILDVYWCPIEKEWILKIVDFSNWDLEQTEYDENIDDSCSISADGMTRRFNNTRAIRKKSFIKSNCPTGGCIRIYESVMNDADTEPWHKVEYNAGWWKQHTWRSGTCTSSVCDAPGLVRARAQFLIDHSELLPPYSAVRSNCECVAVWCKTGTWSTLQASSWLYVTAASQAKQAATIAGVASAATVSVPAAGMWGWLGYTSTVSLVSTQPLLLPAIAAYGVVTTAGPALWLLRAKSHWKQLTEQLNTKFWEAAVDHPDIFVECITHWALYEQPKNATNETTTTATTSMTEVQII